MADPEIPANVDQQVNEAVGQVDAEATPAYSPIYCIYKVNPESKIPVSKSLGPLWKARKEAAANSVKGVHSAWQEAIKYYKHDQMGARANRTSADNASGNVINARRIGSAFSETENIVFANISATLPTLYAKNPKAEFTSDNTENVDLATTLEDLMNTLAARKAAPGLNLKLKARRGVITTMLTNRAWMEIGYVMKEDSLEQAQTELQKLTKELQEAKDQAAIQEVEGKLMALEETIDALAPSGPHLRLLSPFNVLVDPESQLEDATDARWIMVKEFYPRDYINAKYAEKGDDGAYRLAYDATHVLGGAKDAAALDDVNSFTLLKDSEKASDYGYADDKAFQRSQMICCWKVWDKVTRRVYLFHDQNWSSPIWVWEDPYSLDTFFPFYSLSFHVDPEGPNAKGETTYYLDQQDAVNEINSAIREARLWAKKNIFYDKNSINRDDVEKALKGDTDYAVGIDLPEGMKIEDLIFSVVPPSMRYSELFSKDDKYQAIDRITGTNEILRGGQFKTNTTNGAIERYDSTTAIRLDEKIDAIEDWLGAIFWGVSQLCLQFMAADQVKSFTGNSKNFAWRNISAEEIRSGALNMRVVGGSTQKPTSKAKKSEAIELGQVLGQFVNAAPQVVMRIMLQALEQAFDEIVVTDEDWVEIKEAIAGAAAGGPPATGEGAPAAAAPAGAGAATGGAPNGQDQIQQLEQMIDSLPPQAKQAIGLAISRGAPIRQTLEAVLAAASPDETGETIQ